MSKRFYILFAICVIIIGCGYAYDPLYYIGCMIALFFALFTIIDLFILYYRGNVIASRIIQSRWSNGDDNDVEIILQSDYPFMVNVEVIDELPVQLQVRDFSKKVKLSAKGNVTDGSLETSAPINASIKYNVCPKERGVYSFGIINLLIKSPLGLAVRRIKSGKEADVKVYPSYQKLYNYELASINTHNIEASTKRVRKIGNATEFAQIKDYMPDDDYRKINWKASARRNQLMVNVYEDEKAQFVYNIIDKGRVMQQSFEKMTLLDHSVNASLALSHIALKKDDNIGLLTFDNHPGSFVPSTRHNQQMNRILETLYNIQTDFQESDFSALSEYIDKHITKRSLLILYTNFFSLDALQRQLPYLKSINRKHRLLVVFFEDDEQNEYMRQNPEYERDYFRHVIAEKYAFERKSMVTMLVQQGILALLTEPKNLSVDIINKYLDIKSRNMV